LTQKKTLPWHEDYVESEQKEFKKFETKLVQVSFLGYPVLRHKGSLEMHSKRKHPSISVMTENINRK
jgi:hypothetical protein